MTPRGYRARQFKLDDFRTKMKSDDKFRRAGVAYANMRTMLRNANSPR